MAGGTSPSLASVTVMGRSRAIADSPRQVARVKGMQNLQGGPTTSCDHNDDGNCSDDEIHNSNYNVDVNIIVHNSVLNNNENHNGDGNGNGDGNDTDTDNRQ